MKEDGKMLRTSFNTNVYTREADCEIQFGTIKRPTHGNTSWDMAKGEICAQRWIDLSQRDYGVALINDSKYGHNISETKIDLNLLRSPDIQIQMLIGESMNLLIAYSHTEETILKEMLFMKLMKLMLQYK